MDSLHAGIRTSKTVNGVVYNYYYDGSQLVRMTYGDNVLDFSYDINGVPVAMRHGYASHNNYVVYYYITNLQGDVVRLVDIYGNTAAYYEYDAFGNVLEASGSHANVNPLRYRGYVYDTDTGLYYLQSRYYDPKVGRFINADAYASTGQGILGNNMFSYCGSNPVNFIDPSGYYFYTYHDGNTPIEHMNGLVHTCGGGGGGVGRAMTVSGDVFSHLYKSIELNTTALSNTSEQVVLESTGLSFYNGVPVIRADLGDGGAFSFGIIVLDDDYIHNLAGINVLKHEYGHRQHMDDIGMVPYFFTTAIPSLICAGLTNARVLPNDLYYNLPWEHVADMYGGVNRPTHTNWAHPAAEAFWAYTVVVSIWIGGAI